MKSTLPPADREREPVGKNTAHILKLEFRALFI